jgi:hypothetical protein
MFLINLSIVRLVGVRESYFYQIKFQLTRFSTPLELTNISLSGVEAFIQNRQFQLFIILYIPSQQLYLSTH